MVVSTKVLTNLVAFRELGKANSEKPRNLKFCAPFHVEWTLISQNKIGYPKERKRAENEKQLSSFFIIFMSTEKLYSSEQSFYHFIPKWGRWGGGGGMGMGILASSFYNT